MEQPKYNVLDLFSGAGGLSRGFLDAGFNVILGVDNDEMALKTFAENHGNTATMKLDLFNHNNLNEITKYLISKGVTIDVLVGGPPCQGFSISGEMKEDDERNMLYTAMVELAKKIKPKFVVLENVMGMIKLYDGKGAKRVIKGFEEIGYKMKAEQLYAPDFGIPQIRRRVFFVGTLDDKIDFKYPKPTYTEETYISCEQAISDLPSLEDGVWSDEQEYTSAPTTDYQKLMRGNTKTIYNHIGSRHTEKTINLISQIPAGKNHKCLPEELKKGIKYNDILTRFFRDKPSHTITTGHRTHFHYQYNRIPTVRECARLQSFPDDFIFYGNKGQQYKQVGNAVPPILGKCLAMAIKEYLDGSVTI
ncbi:DNA cytosine methyltransferase [Sedimentibacter sp.]|uniref:DNA cytosine methyltransferase n=1 Tax=Sedimentibacter sp. TaxID=1960295 RepID=UPI002896D7B4|nr:DNA cytosine methyltransferase [Sedimentibacter sp.]